MCSAVEVEAVGAHGANGEVSHLASGRSTAP
jgi:hypothetical protein